MSTWRRKRFARKSFRQDSFSVKKTRLILKLAKFSLLGVVLVFLSSFIIFPLFAFNLPSPDKIVRREGFSTKILDRNGEVLYDIYADQRRTAVPLSDIPVYLRQ